MSELLQTKAEYEVRDSVEIHGHSLPKKQNVFAGAAGAGPGSKAKSAGGPFVPKITVTGHQDG